MMGVTKMTWNKCSEKLPVEGMLVIARYNGNYYAEIVQIDREGIPYIGNVDSGFIHFMRSEESLEWKKLQGLLGILKTSLSSIT